MRAFILLLLLLFSGCATNKACEQMEHRLSAIKAFCESIIDEQARSMCGDEEDEAFSKCVQVVILNVTKACVVKSGADKIAWAQSEFCK